MLSTFSIFLDSSMVEHSAVNRRVVGSSPTRGVCCMAFAADTSYQIRLRGQAVKTSPFHGGNTGSIPGDALESSESSEDFFLF